jgi:hypothetical protein
MHLIITYSVHDLSVEVHEKEDEAIITLLEYVKHEVSEWDGFELDDEEEDSIVESALSSEGFYLSPNKSEQSDITFFLRNVANDYELVSKETMNYYREKNAVKVYL